MFPLHFSVVSKCSPTKRLWACGGGGGRAVVGWPGSATSHRGGAPAELSRRSHRRGLGALRRTCSCFRCSGADTSGTLPASARLPSRASWSWGQQAPPRARPSLRTQRCRACAPPVRPCTPRTVLPGPEAPRDTRRTARGHPAAPVTRTAQSRGPTEAAASPSPPAKPRWGPGLLSTHGPSAAGRLPGLPKALRGGVCPCLWGRVDAPLSCVGPGPVCHLIIPESD